MSAITTARRVMSAVGEEHCAEESGTGYTCTAQRGHAGPDHIAYGVTGRVCHRWPVTTEQAEVPAS